MFIAALFTITRTWKQPRCPSMDVWIKKMWYVYTMEYYSAMKKKAFESVLVRYMNLESVMKREVKSERERRKNSYLWNLEKWCRWTNLQGRNRDPDAENGHVNPGGKERVGWIGRLPLPLPCVKQRASGNLMHSAGSSAQRSVMT